MKTLLEILSLKRPHGGVGERFVAEEILSRLPYELMYYAPAGKPMAYLITTDPESTTLFVSHLDTVHREDGPNPVVYDESSQWMYKDTAFVENVTPLGADDGAGVWLLYKMIEAGVPGTYLFTVGEECGGVGAKWMSECASDFLGKFERAIEFDRRGTTSVITHQGFGRCCSDDFAQSLADKLGMDFKPDNTGVYTDTAEFTEIIPECTNISCGYDREHSGAETLDVAFLEDLLVVCLSLDWSSLPVVRDPAEVDAVGYEGAWWDKPANSDVFTVDDLYTMTPEERLDMCYDDPDKINCLLTELMYNGVTLGGN